MEEVSENAFRKGDRVFDIRFGWGVVDEGSPFTKYKTKVFFDDGKIEHYTDSGFYVDTDLIPMLSYTEYNHQGSSQERPIPDNVMNILNELNKLNEGEMKMFQKYFGER